MFGDNKKVYMVYVRGQTAGEMYLLSEAGPAEFMGLPAVKGRYHTPTASKMVHWMDGHIFYIPLDKILFVTEYDSMLAFQEAVKKYNATKPAEGTA